MFFTTSVKLSDIEIEMDVDHHYHFKETTLLRYRDFKIDITIAQLAKAISTKEMQSFPSHIYLSLEQ